jgi:hypothetical protein
MEQRLAVAWPFHARRKAARAAGGGLAGCAAGKEAVRVKNPNCHPLIRRQRGLFGPTRPERARWANCHWAARRIGGPGSGDMGRAAKRQAGPAGCGVGQLGRVWLQLGRRRPYRPAELCGFGWAERSNVGQLGRRLQSRPFCPCG